MSTAPVRGCSDPRVDLRGDFRGTADMTAADPTPEGRRFFTLTAGVIDMDAEAFFGRGMCHWLASAIHSITGWDIAVVDYDSGAFGWQQAHSAVITPRGTLLDIFGERSPDTVRRFYTNGGAHRSRLREISGRSIPGALQPRDDFRRDPLWWCEQFASPESQAVLLHFARLLLRNHGYADHIDPAALERPMPQPRPPSDTAPSTAPAAPTAHTATTPVTGGGGPAMSNIEEARAILTNADGKAEGLQGLLAQAAQEIGEISAGVGQAAAGSANPAIQEATQLYAQLANDIEQALGMAAAARTAVAGYVASL